MLDGVDLKQSMAKSDYKEQTGPLKTRLSELQHKVKSSGLPVMVLFEGWGAAGKGSVMGDVIQCLDPRNFSTMSTLPPTPEEQRKPFLWRHWCTIPPQGNFAFYDESWYPEVVNAWAAGGEKESLKKLDSINTFERQLADDGTLVIKLFLHISEKEQRRRMERLEDKKSTAWRVKHEDILQNKHYKRYFKIFDEVLTRTNSENAPWHVVPAHDRYTALAEIYQTIVDLIEAALLRRQEKKPPEAPESCRLTPGPFSVIQMPALKEIKLGQSLPRDKYSARLKADRKRLAQLHNKIYLKKIPIVICYEGWDAAGKGGNIRRLTAALDPRGYEVVPIASPTPPEKARHYLWRFWSQLPKDGHITLFDRTWYGRVMVERIEGFARPDEWQRAYREINEFEAELADWGAIIIKFWLHIDKEEQLQRFEARQNTPEKQWKITDEDWRNREKWDAYEVAVNDMLRLTSTDFAPWTIIESNDKLYARIKALDTVIDRIEERL